MFEEDHSQIGTVGPDEETQRSAVDALAHARIGRLGRAAVRTSLQHLPDCLRRGERPLLIVRADHGTNVGLLALTDRRVIFLRYDGPGKKEVRHELPYALLTNVEAIKNRKLLLVAGGKELEFAISKDVLPDVTESIREYKAQAEAVPPDDLELRLSTEGGPLEEVLDPAGRERLAMVEALANENIAGLGRAMVRPALQHLPSCLDQDERPLMVVRAEHHALGGAAQHDIGLLALTDRRAIFLRYDGPGKKEVRYELPYAMLAKVEQKTGLVGGETLYLLADNDEFEFSISEDVLPRIVEVLRERVAAAKASPPSDLSELRVNVVRSGFGERALARRLKAEVKLEVIEMTHAIVRLQPLRPGFEGHVPLPSGVCAWCGRREATLTVESANAGNCTVTEGVYTVPYDLDWRMEIPYCDECHAKSALVGWPAVLWGHHRVEYERPRSGGVRHGTHIQYLVPGWIAWLDLVFVNADVARRTAASLSTEAVEWDDRGLHRYGRPEGAGWALATGEPVWDYPMRKIGGFWTDAPREPASR